MKTLSEYRIAVQRLSDGNHDFHWKISKAFFEKDPNSEIRDAVINADVELIKSDRLMELHFHFSGQLTIACDRCLDDLLLTINSDKTLLVRKGRESIDGQENKEDIVFIQANDPQIDLHQIMYDFILLSIPMRKVHPEGECNSEMMDRFQNIHIEDFEED